MAELPQKHGSDIERVILEMLADRDEGKTICPSEAARRMAERAGTPDRWREWLTKTRATAIEMASRGRIEILQHGKRIDPASARGAIRLGLP